MNKKTGKQINTETVKILEKLHEKKGTETETNKAKIENICSLLHALPDFDVSKEIPEIYRYLNDSQSELESNILDTILTKLNRKVENNISGVENNVIERMNKTTRSWLNVFLTLIAAFALAAVVFTVLNLVYGEEFLNGWCGKIASAFGTLDFALGALGFILERKDDMKKRDVQYAAQYAKETGDAKKFINIVKSFNTRRNIGNVKGDYVEGDKIVK